jgi:hypothetical protein
MRHDKHEAGTEAIGFSDLSELERRVALAVEQKLTSTLRNVPAQKWLRQQLAAAYIGVEPTTLIKWRREGFGPTSHVLGTGRNAPRLFKISDLDEFVSAHGGETAPAQRGPNNKQT